MQDLESSCAPHLLKEVPKRHSDLIPMALALFAGSLGPSECVDVQQKCVLFQHL